MAAFYISIAGIVFWVFIFKSLILSANNIPTGSMIPTLKIGDFLFVNRMRYGVHIPFTDINIYQYSRPKRGDIIVFTPPQIGDLRGKTLVKRVIAVPGDVVVVRDDEIYVNNVHYPVRESSDRHVLKSLDYPKTERLLRVDDLDLYKEKVMDPNTGEVMVDHYMLKQNLKKIKEIGEPENMLRNPRDPFGGPTQFTVPAGKFMAMGDNRDDSSDSRVWGFVNGPDIHGKVFIVYFSVNWGTRFLNEEVVNPFFNLFRLVTGQLHDVSVRWNRVGQIVH